MRHLLKIGLSSRYQFERSDRQPSPLRWLDVIELFVLQDELVVLSVFAASMAKWVIRSKRVVYLVNLDEALGTATVAVDIVAIIATLAIVGLHHAVTTESSKHFAPRCTLTGIAAEIEAITTTGSLDI